MSGTFAAALAACILTSPVLTFAQGAADDPYGIGSPSTPSTPSPAAPSTPAPRDSVRTPARAALPDTVKTPAVAPAAVPAPVPVVVPDTTPRAAVDTTPAPRAPRPKITRETTVNPMDVHRGTYRNPKKALFMSLIVPGLGQAYIGQSKFNYIRAAGYFTAEVTMGVLWYQFSVVKYDRKVKEYRAYADQHWSQADYEVKITEVIGGAGSSRGPFDLLNPGRTSYCNAVQERQTGSGANNYAGCLEPYADNQEQNYSNFRTSTLSDDPTTAAGLEAIKNRRAAFPDPVAFYEMIGSNQEFLYGWSDVAADPSLPAGGSNPGYEVLGDTAASWNGTSAYRDHYNSMRRTAKEYSRMQAWFLGGIVLNHIASAVDAALTARRHNRILYEDGDARWYDRVNVDGGMAFEQGRPVTHMTAYLSF